MNENNKSLSPLAPFREVLTIAHFRNLWFGQIASQLANSTLLFALGIRVYETTGSNTAVSAIFLVYGIAAALFGAAGGAIVDKLDKRHVLILCDFSRALTVFIFFFFSENIGLVYILTFLNAIITQLYVPAEAPTIPRIIPEKHLVTANSLFSFTYFTSVAIGSILSGPLLRIFGHTGVFFSLSVLFVIAGLNVWQLPRGSSHSDLLLRLHSWTITHVFRRLVITTKEGIAYVIHSPSLKDALVLLAGTQVILAVLGTLGPGFADKVMQIDIRDSSLLITGPAVVGIILGALWVGSVGEKYSSKWLIKRGILLAGFILIVISVLVRLKRVPVLSGYLDEGVLHVIVLFLFFFLGVANSMLDVPANSTLQREAEGDMQGRVYGMLTATVGGIGVLPVIVGGILADTLGVGKVILAMGILITAYGLYKVRYNTDVPD